MQHIGSSTHKAKIKESPFNAFILELESDFKKKNPLNNGNTLKSPEGKEKVEKSEDATRHNEAE